MVFDDANKGTTRGISFNVEVGDSDWSIEIPGEWESPYRTLASPVEYYVPDQRQAIDDVNQILAITGADFFLDVTRERGDEEQNQRSIEGLITAIGNNDSLSGRQKFYICLVSLQSWFEYIVHGMLVLSEHVSKTRFNALSTHEARTRVAFDSANTDFFSTAIQIAPGKGDLGSDISATQRAEMENIVNEVRALRNKVVHRWGYKDIGRERLTEMFQRMGENPIYDPDDDGWYAKAAFLFVRLYAKTNPLKNQLSLFVEREAVRAERAARGY